MLPVPRGDPTEKYETNRNEPIFEAIARIWLELRVPEQAAGTRIWAPSSPHNSILPCCRFMGEAPKYTRLEHERRFLVDSESRWELHVKPYSKAIQARYLDGGRLLLRRIQDSDKGRVVFKLTKKFESGSSFSQPIVSVQLSLSEYEALAGLPGLDLSKIAAGEAGAAGRWPTAEVALPPDR